MTACLCAGVIGGLVGLASLLLLLTWLYLRRPSSRPLPPALGGPLSGRSLSFTGRGSYYPPSVPAAYGPEPGMDETSLKTPMVYVRSLSVPFFLAAQPFYSGAASAGRTISRVRIQQSRFTLDYEFHRIRRADHLSRSPLYWRKRTYWQTLGSLEGEKAFNPLSDFLTSRLSSAFAFPLSTHSVPLYSLIPLGRWWSLMPP